MADADIIETCPEKIQTVKDILEDGEKIAETPQKEVYSQKESDHVVKVIHNTAPEKFRKQASLIRYDLSLDVFIGNLDLGNYGFKPETTAVLQEKSTGSMREKIRAENQYPLIGELVDLLDRAIDTGTVFSDPALDNFHYNQEDELKLMDLYDPGNQMFDDNFDPIRKFPHSYTPDQGLQEFEQDVKRMYRDLICALPYETDIRLDGAAETVEDNSRHIKRLQIRDDKAIFDLTGRLRY